MENLKTSVLGTLLLILIALLAIYFILLYIAHKKDIKFLKGILFSIFLFSLYFFICPNLFAIILKNGLLSENFWIHNLSYLAIYVFTLLVVLLIIRKDITKQFKEFIKNPKPILSKGFTYWIYGMIVMIISNLIVTAIIGNIAVNEQMTRETLITAPLYAIPTIILIGPFMEEIVFRYGFRKSFNKEIPYALFCAVIFGGMHIISAIDTWTIAGILAHAKELLFLIPYGSLGYFFAKAYYETENIFSSVIPHMLHNTISVTLILITHFFNLM